MPPYSRACAKYSVGADGIRRWNDGAKTFVSRGPFFLTHPIRIQLWGEPNGLDYCLAGYSTRTVRIS